MNVMKRSIIAKEALFLLAKSETQLASQIFAYDLIREIRVDLKKLEVKVLMTYDEAYFKVYDINLNNESERQEAENIITNFYNNLNNAVMRLTKEDVERIKQQNEARMKEVEEKQNQETSLATKEKSKKEK